MGSRWPGELGALEAQVLKDQRIDGEDVLRLRRAIYQDGDIGRVEAEFLFHLNRNSQGNDPAWATFFVEALTDFFYWRKGSDSRLSEDAEELLLKSLGDARALDDATELHLLLSVLFRTNDASERLRQFALDAVRHSVLHSETALFGHGGRTPGAIDAADVEVIRKLVYGMGSQNGLGISQAEAEFLFELNRETSGAENHPAWRDLFVKAVTMYLLFGGSSPERVDEAEAQWLVQQMGPSGQEDDNQRALVAYLKREAQSLPPVLAPLCQRLGV